MIITNKAQYKLITPTSVSGSGVSLSGPEVSFTASDSICVNGVFSTLYDNYVILSYMAQSSGALSTSYIRLRSNGTSVSATNYSWQFMNADGTTASGQRLSPVSECGIFIAGTNLKSACNIFVYGPALPQQTTFRSVTVSGNSGAHIRDYAGTHSLLAPYDGFEITGLGTAPLTGSLSIYGLSQ